MSSEALVFKPRNHSVVSQREEFLPAGAHSDHVVTFIIFISLFFVEFIWKRAFMLTDFFKEETLCQTICYIHSAYVVYVE